MRLAITLPTVDVEFRADCVVVTEHATGRQETMSYEALDELLGAVLTAENVAIEPRR